MIQGFPIRVRINLGLSADDRPLIRPLRANADGDMETGLSDFEPLYDS